MKTKHDDDCAVHHADPPGICTCGYAHQQYVSPREYTDGEAIAYSHGLEDGKEEERNRECGCLDQYPIAKWEELARAQDRRSAKIHGCPWCPECGGRVNE